MKKVVVLFVVVLGSFATGFAQESGIVNSLQFDHRASIGFGIQNFKVDYTASAVLKDRFILGAGLGFYTNKVKVPSSSDIHKFKLGSLPVYLVAQVNVYKNNKENVFYLKGGYGNVNNFSFKEIDTDLTYKPRMYFGGAGYQFFIDKWSRNAFVEVSQFVSSAKGTTTSTYDSEIKYNLDVYAVHLSFGMKLNKY